MMNVGLSKGKKRLLVNIITLVLIALLYGIIFFTSGQNLFGGKTPVVLGRFQMRIINNAMIGIIMAVSLNMVTGLMGQLVLGHAGFMLIGAYASALFTMNMTWDISTALPISLIIAGFVSAFFGVIIGIPALRLRGDYLAIITLGFGEIIRVVSNNLKITNGAKGLNGIQGYDDATGFSMFTLIFFIMVFVIYATYAYGTSRHGRAVISIREDEIAAESIGIQTTQYKLLTFVIAAFIAGVAGGLFAHQQRVIDPSSFGFNKSVEYLAMVVLGGMGSITGSVLSAFVLTALPEFLRAFSNYRMLVYSLLLVIIMLFRPTGLLGRKEFSLTKIIDKITGFKDRNRRGGE